MQWNAVVNAQLNDRPRHITAAREGARIGWPVALQCHGCACVFNLGQIVHIGVCVCLRLRGPRLFSGQRIARRHGIALSLRELRAVALVFEDFGLAPLVQLKCAIPSSRTIISSGAAP